MMKGTLLLCMAVLVIGVSAQAGLYSEGPFGGGTVAPAYYSDPPNNTVLVPAVNLNVNTPTISLPGSPNSIVSYVLKLTFASDASSSLSGSISLPAVDGASQSFNVADGAQTGYEYDLSFSSGALYGQDPNQVWHLFLEDTAGPGGTGISGNTLTGWSLDITAVPEPVNVALGIFAGVFVVGGLSRTERARNLFGRCRVGVNHWLDAA